MDAACARLTSDKKRNFVPEPRFAGSSRPMNLIISPAHFVIKAGNECQQTAGRANAMG